MNTTTRRRKAPHRGWSTLLCLGIPVAVFAAAVAWIVALSPALPDPIAVHWNIRGEADGFAPLGDYVAVMAIPVVAVAVLAWALAFFVGGSGVTRRIAAGTSVWVAVALSGMTVGSVMMQTPDGIADATGIGTVMVWAFGGALLLAVPAALLMPADPPLPTTAAVPADASRLNLGDQETAVWSRTVRAASSRWLIVIGLVVVAMLLVVFRDYALPILFLALALLVLTALTEWRVTVDDTGLRVRSLLPIFRVTVPLDEVESAETTTVSPMRDFGGWGVRVNLSGTVGVVVRTGIALRVHRTGDRTLVVTVDDAATAARLLNTLADRTRSR